MAVSGGKDSLALLYALAGLKRFYPASFTICAITIDIGFGMDFTPVQRLCDELDVPFFICHTQIKDIVFHPENPDAGKGLEKDFKLFEEKKLIKKRAETIGNDGVKQVIYQIVF